MKKYEGKRNLSVEVPVELYAMFSKLCIDMGINKTEAVLRYLRYLQAQEFRKRTVLDEQSSDTFSLDERKPAKLPSGTKPKQKRTNG